MGTATTPRVTTLRSGQGTEQSATRKTSPTPPASHQVKACKKNSLLEFITSLKVRNAKTAVDANHHDALIDDCSLARLRDGGGGSTSDMALAQQAASPLAWLCDGGGGSSTENGVSVFLTTYGAPTSTTIPLLACATAAAQRTKP